MLTWPSTTGMARARSHDGSDRRHGHANHVDPSDADDEWPTHEQSSELSDGACGGDGVYYTGGQCDQYEEKAMCSSMTSWSSSGS